MRRLCTGGGWFGHQQEVTLQLFFFLNTHFLVDQLTLVLYGNVDLGPTVQGLFIEEVVGRFQGGAIDPMSHRNRCQAVVSRHVVNLTEVLECRMEVKCSPFERVIVQVQLCHLPLSDEGVSPDPVVSHHTCPPTSRMFHRRFEQCFDVHVLQDVRQACVVDRFEATSHRHALGYDRRVSLRPSFSFSPFPPSCFDPMDFLSKPETDPNAPDSPLP